MYLQIYQISNIQCPRGIKTQSLQSQCDCYRIKWRLNNQFVLDLQWYIRSIVQYTFLYIQLIDNIFDKRNNIKNHSEFLINYCIKLCFFSKLIYYYCYYYHYHHTVEYNILYILYYIIIILLRICSPKSLINGLALRSIISLELLRS